MPTREEVLKLALELSPEDQGILRLQLDERSQTPYQLQGGLFATPELTAKWSAEIDRRMDALQRGEIETVDHETAIKHIRDALEANRKKNNLA